MSVSRINLVFIATKSCKVAPFRSFDWIKRDNLVIKIERAVIYQSTRVLLHRQLLWLFATMICWEVWQMLKCYNNFLNHLMNMCMLTVREEEPRHSRLFLSGRIHIGKTSFNILQKSSVLTLKKYIKINARTDWQCLWNRGYLFYQLQEHLSSSIWERQWF